MAHNAVWLSADGRRLAVRSFPAWTSTLEEKGSKKIGFKDVGVRVFDTITGKELLSVRDLPAPLTRMRLSADGKRLVAHLGFLPRFAAATRRSELVVWDVDANQKIGSYPLPTAPALKNKLGEVVHRLEAVSADGRLAAFSYERAKGETVLKVWKLPQNKDAAQCTEIYERDFPNEQLPVPLPQRNAAWFSSNGRFLIFCTPFNVGRKWANHVVDLRTKKLWSFHGTATYRQYSPISAISPDGHLVALIRTGRAASENSLKTRDIVVMDWKGKTTFRLMGHTQSVAGVAFSPDGQRLASIDNSGEIKLWDLRNRQEVLTLTTPSAAMAALQFSGDGHRLFLVAFELSGKPGYTLHTWDATPLPGSVR
jgi:WD40 repeat protein